MFLFNSFMLVQVEYRVLPFYHQDDFQRILRDQLLIR